MEPYFFALPMLLIGILYVAVLGFVIWAVLQIIRSLERIAEGQERSASMLESIAISLEQNRNAT